MPITSEAHDLEQSSRKVWHVMPLVTNVRITTSCTYLYSLYEFYKGRTFKTVVIYHQKKEFQSLFYSLLLIAWIVNNVWLKRLYFDIKTYICMLVNLCIRIFISTNFREAKNTSLCIKLECKTRAEIAATQRNICRQWFSSLYYFRSWAIQV